MSFLLTLVKLLKKPRVLVVTLLGLLLLLLFALGAKLGINVFWRLIIGGALLVLGLFFAWLAGRIEQRRQADQIEQSLVLEASGGGADDKTRRRLAREEMAAAIARLKASRLADGRSGRDALSVLPWYLVLGAPASGKSAMIANSGLPFPTAMGTNGSLSTEGSNCNWWFSNQAVLLEADGRFAVDPGRTADADWDLFLSLLRKQQREPAVNGIVVTVSADDLVTRDEVWLRERAELLRRRLDRIAGSLDLLCPVYLVVTRCDLVNGFQEFFGDLRGSARDQVWGATFSTNLMTGAAPGELFQQEFDLLTRGLDRRRLFRLVRTENERATQQQAFLFPLEFYKLRDKLRGFSEALFAPSSYTHQPPWRGFYFTSVGGGTVRPAETVLADVSQVIGLPGFSGYAPPPVAQAAPEPRFLKTLFLNVLVPDQGLARLTAQALRRRHSWRLVLRGLAVLLLPLFLTWTAVSLVRNLQLGQQCAALADSARGVAPAGEQPRDVSAALARLEPLRAQLAQIDAWDRRRPVSLDLGLYRGDRLGAGLRQIYFDRLRTALLRPSRDRLEIQLMGEYPDSPAAFNSYFDRYQVYRMLIEPDWGRPELITATLRALWHDPAGDPETTTRQLQLVDAHVAYAWRHLPDLRDAASNLPRANATLVGRAESNIREYWAVDLYYDNLIADINQEGRPFSVASEAEFSGVFKGAEDADLAALNVPFAFTRSGWREQAMRRIQGSEQELKDNWLLQEAFRDRTMDIRSELLGKYLTEHRQRWVAFLSTVDVASPLRPAEVHATLQRLAPRNSRLFRFLERVRDTMDLTGETKGLVAGDAAALEQAMADFRSWREFFRQQGAGDQAFEPAAEYAKLLGDLVGFLQELIKDGDSLVLVKAAEASRAVFQSEGRSDQTALGKVSVRIPNLVVKGGASACEQALAVFLRRSVQLTWNACLRATEEQLDSLWRDTVAREYTSRLAGYPLNPDARFDVSVGDFATFFRPGGTLDDFVTRHLGVYLSGDSRPRTVLDGSLRLQAQVSVALRKAAALRAVLFAGNATSPHFTFRLKPLQYAYSRSSGPTITHTVLRLGSETLEYELGQAPVRSFEWSGERPLRHASLRLVPEGVVQGHRIEDSDWALFRLLDLAETVPDVTELRFQVNWFLKDAQQQRLVKVPYELTATTANNPFKSGFFKFDCPRTLLR
jgi:type VI secretion system protein ImpL